ncbi:Secreted protein [Bacillus pseudomycoides]
MKKKRKNAVIGGVLSAAILSSALLPSTSAFAATEAAPNLNKTTAPVTQAAKTVDGDVSAQGWKTKLAAEAIRKAGWLVSKLAGKISKKAERILSNNLNKIANWIEKAGDVQEWALASFLVSLGIPPGDAAAIAHWIVLFFGL